MLQEEQKKTEAIQQKTEAGFQMLQEEQKKTEVAQQKTEVALRDLKETVAKTSESIDKANGNFNNKWGEFLENFIEGDLLNIFKKRNIEVNRILPRVIVKRSDNTLEAEYDFIVANGEEVIVIEVKTTVSSSKVGYLHEQVKSF